MSQACLLLEQGSRFGLAGFNIRGIEGNRVLTVVDGIRVADEFSFGPFLSARRDFVDVDSLEVVEIARGPISSLYGSDALGGVVSMTTRTPQSYLTGGDGFAANVKAGYSGDDNSLVGALNLALGDETIAGLLSYTKRSSRRPRPTALPEVSRRLVKKRIHKMQKWTIYRLSFSIPR